jgi:hypothetical protein
VFKKACHFTLFWTRWIQSTPSCRSVSIHFNIILSSMPMSPKRSVLQLIVYMHYLHSTCPVHLLLQSTPSCRSFRFILILSSHPRLCLPEVLFSNWTFTCIICMLHALSIFCSSPRHHVLFFRSILILSSHLRLCLLRGLFSNLTFTCIICILHAPPILFSSISSSYNDLVTLINYKACYYVTSSLLLQFLSLMFKYFSHCFLLKHFQPTLFS